jgi:hypothetical protein
MPAATLALSMRTAKSGRYIIITRLPGIATPMDLAPQSAQAWATRPILLALTAAVSLATKAAKGEPVSITLVPE